jgi:hypothetical protein
MMLTQYTKFRYSHGLRLDDFWRRPIIEDTNLKGAERSSRLFALLAIAFARPLLSAHRDGPTKSWRAGCRMLRQ